MICKVRKTIDAYGLLTDVKTVAVGVSGGADSMCLLHILSSLKDDYDIILKAVHINHNIRGEEAVRDQEFVRNFCLENGIEFHLFDENIPEIAAKLGLGLEECGRQVRYRCFEALGCDAVAVAHSMSDSVETMLFNLARGTSLKGLRGIPVKREPNIIRPLIECTREEIEEYCEKNSVSYITDSTNLSDCYMRNHIRHNLLPDFEKVNSAFLRNISRCMNSLCDDDDFLTKESYDVLCESRCDSGYINSVIKKSHPSIRKRVLSLILKDYMNKPVEAKHIELLDSIVLAENGKIEIAKDLYFSAKNDMLYVHRCEHDKILEKCSFKDGVAVTEKGKILLVKTDEIIENSFDYAKVNNELYVSSRLQGDKITLKNRGITKTLKKLFNELGIPAEERDSIAVVHDGENVVWVEGIGVNAQYIPDDNSKNIVVIIKEG